MSRPWTAAQDAKLRRLYAEHTGAVVARLMGRTEPAIANRVVKLGLRKEHNAGGFQKGQTPWNKGLKGLDIGGKATRFKPGQMSGRAAALYQPIGTERINKDGYLERKISDDPQGQRRWRGVHLLIWEEANGPLPKGCAVVFRDGNNRNFDINNLELVTRAELMRRNSYHTYPKEVAQLIQLRGALNRQINKRTAA